jgi:4a-hydroxytetrahydrobiopterin dehydratase
LLNFLIPSFLFPLPSSFIFLASSDGIPPTAEQIAPADPSISSKLLAQNYENSKLKPLSEKQISQRLQNLPKWTREGKTIKYTHEFKNFVEAVSFVNCLISPSEKAGHHPDITIAYNRVTISLTTHDAEGLTQQDFDLAETISKLVSDWRPGNVCLVVEGSG